MLRPAPLLALLLGTALLRGQQASLHAGLAADPDGSGPAALVWLRREYLPALATWPHGRDPLAAVVVHWRGQEFTFDELPGTGAGGYAQGEFCLPGADSVLFSCGTDGVEDWFVPANCTPSGRPAQLVRALGIRTGAPARTIDIAAMCGNLGGSLPADDPRLQWIGLGAANCGELTFTCWQVGDRLRVRGRSGGGLLLPAFLAFAATLPPGADASARWATVPDDDTARWSLRAFAGRDSDRAEATRQLAAASDPRARTTLRLLLRADASTRTAAMDGLVRLQAAEQLPRILAAADPALPDTVAMAGEAVTELWPELPLALRGQVRAALENHPAEALRQLDPDRDSRNAGSDPVGVQALPNRWLLPLLATGAGLLGLWLRERQRLRA